MKKENNRKNYVAHKAWLERKRTRNTARTQLWENGRWQVLANLTKRW